MLNSSLLELFKFLTPSDKKGLKKFVRSPFYNQREDVVLLFDYLEKFADTEPLKLAKEKVFDAVYPNQKYNVDAMYFIMSTLTQLINKFLTVTEFENKEIEKKLILVEALKKRGAEKFTEKTLSEANQLLEKQKLRNAEYHYLKFKIKYSEFDLKQWKKRDDDFEIQEMIDDFHFYTMSEILKLACITISHKSISKKEYRLPLLEFIGDVARKHLGEPSVASHLYSYIFSEGEMKSESAQNAFLELKKIIFNQSELFELEEIKDFYLSAINYCIRKQNYGEIEFIREALTLYQEGLKTKILFDEGSISQYNYRNINMLALKINDFDFAENFLNTYKSFLPAKDREDIFQFNLGFFYFRKGDHTKAMSLLSKVNSKEANINLDARRVLARVYYELKEFKALQSHIETSKVYLHRQKDMSYGKEAYTNFFKFLEAVLNSDIKTKTERAKIVENIKTAKLCAEREWLAGLIKV